MGASVSSFEANDESCAALNVSYYVGLVCGTREIKSCKQLHAKIGFFAALLQGSVIFLGVLLYLQRNVIWASNRRKVEKIRCWNQTDKTP